jgi:hypothetical protein
VVHVLDQVVLVWCHKRFFILHGLVYRSKVHAATAAFLQFDLYARPSEILQLRGRDLIPSVAAFKSP